MNESISIRSLRWLARVLSLPCIGLVLLFVFGEGFPMSAFTARDLCLFLLFPLGICLGMIVAWWRDGLGGSITIGSLAAFYLMHYVLSQQFPGGFAFLLLALPGFLFLICWLGTPSRTR